MATTMHRQLAKPFEFSLGRSSWLTGECFGLNRPSLRIRIRIRITYEVDSNTEVTESPTLPMALGMWPNRGLVLPTQDRIIWIFTQCP